MRRHTFVVSNPPHAGEVDFPKAAACLGLSPVDVRLKTKYHLPEVWHAGLDRAEIEATAQTLRDAGLTVVVVTGAEFRRVPAQSPASTCAFRDEHLVIGLREGIVELAYDDPVLAMVHIPSRDADGAGDSSPAFLDMYINHGHDVQRISVFEDTVDLEGLGDDNLPSRHGNMREFFTEWEGRFAQATINRRLMNLLPRRTVTLDDLTALEERRKGYSYGSRGLLELLDIVAPGLMAVSLADFSSRLIYLTMQHA